MIRGAAIQFVLLLAALALLGPANRRRGLSSARAGRSCQSRAAWKRRELCSHSPAASADKREGHADVLHPPQRPQGNCERWRRTTRPFTSPARLFRHGFLWDPRGCRLLEADVRQAGNRANPRPVPGRKAPGDPGAYFKMTVKAGRIVTSSFRPRRASFAADEVSYASMTALGTDELRTIPP